MNWPWTWLRACAVLSGWLTFIPRGTVPTAEFTTSSRLHPAPEETRPPQSDPNNDYPNIPTGQTVISPIELKTFGSSCKIARKNNSTPSYFEDGSNSLWSCNIPEQGPMQWDIDDWPQALSHTETDLAMLGSVPDTLTCEEWEGGKWGGYLMSSEVGEWSVERRNTVFKTVNGETVRYAPSFGYREGMQGPSFYRQPLAFQDSSTTLTKRTDNTTGSMSYSFGILYNKTVVLRETTMIQTHNTGGKSESRFGDGLSLQVSEKVWMCVWEKTLLEVTLMVKEPSMAQISRDAAIAHGVGQGEDTADDDDSNATATTTITVGLVPSSEPSSPPSSKGPPPPHPNPPLLPPPPPLPYPPPPPSKSDHPHPAKWIKAIKGPRHLSRKVYMKESRPSPDRLRRVLGIDLTDPDPDGRATPGPVWCRKMIVQEDGGLAEFNAQGEEMVETTLVEKIDDYIPDADFVEGKDNIREFPPDTGCICTWES